MFLGYQLRFTGYENQKMIDAEGNEYNALVETFEPFISMVAETREELENMDYMEFSSIEETDKTYFLHNGVYVESLTYEEVRQKRSELYALEVDPLTAQINRLRDEEQTPEIVAKIASLVEERKAIVAKIKAENPYPTETANGGI